MFDVTDIQRRICEEAQRGASVGEFRQRVLELLAKPIGYDIGLFHELSPRVPLSRAAMVNLDLAAVTHSRESWDELAVALGRLRDAALARGGVATTRDTLPAKTLGRRAWDTRVAPWLGAREAMLAHLMVEGRIVSAIVLARRRTSFGADEQALMRTLVPTLSVCDALRQTVENQALRGLVAELECVDQRLTDRQRELVLLVALGHTDADIAAGLGISANTVRNHLVEIRRRLDATNRAEIVRLAVLR